MALRADGCAFGVAEPGIDIKSRRLAFARQLDGALGCQLPGMIEVEVGYIARQSLRLYESRVRILRGVARDRARLGDGLAHRRGAQVGGARRPLALAEIHRHPETSVALVLDGVDLAQAHAHREPLAERCVCLALRCALALRLGEGERGDIVQLARGVGGVGWWHACFALGVGLKL